MKTGVGKWKLWIQTCQTPLKIDLVPHPTPVEGLGKYIQKINLTISYFSGCVLH